MQLQRVAKFSKPVAERFLILESKIKGLDLATTGWSSNERLLLSYRTSESKTMSGILVAVFIELISSMIFSFRPFS